MAFRESRRHSTSTSQSESLDSVTQLLHHCTSIQKAAKAEYIKFKSLLGKNIWLRAGCKQGSSVWLIRKWEAALTCFPAVEWPSWMFSMFTAMLMLIQIYTLYSIKVVPKVHNLHFHDVFEWFSVTSSCLLSVFTDHSLWGSWDTFLRKCTLFRLLQFKQ